MSRITKATTPPDLVGAPKLPTGWVPFPPEIRCPDCGGSLQKHRYIRADTMGPENGKAPPLPMEVRRRYNCKNRCGFSHVTIEKIADWEQVLVRKVIHEGDPKDLPPQPFSFEKLCDSIALTAGRRSARTGDPVRNRLSQDIAREVMIHLKATITGQPLEIDSRDIGRTVLMVLKRKKLATMWVRFFTVFFNTNARTFDELATKLVANWGDPTLAVYKVDHAGEWKNTVDKQ